MQFNSTVVLVVLVAICSLVGANEEPQVMEVHAEAEEKTSVAPTLSNARMNVGELTSQLTNFLAQGGAAAAGVLVAVALAALIWPALASRMCHITGTCDTYTASPYSMSNGMYPQDYQGTYSQGATYNNPTNYQKRSIEYIAPVLKALGTAYDKYNRQGTAATAKKAA